MRGLSLVETIVTMLILAVVASVVIAVSHSEPRRTAIGLVQQLRLQRYGTTVGGVDTTCLMRPMGAWPVAVVATWPPRGLLFTPDGLPRTCDGGGVGNTTILLEHRGRQAAVIVSSLGRVRWEMR